MSRSQAPPVHPEQPSCHRLAILPGDGIGREVTEQAVGVLREAARLDGCRRLELADGRIGGDALEHHGEPLPAATAELCRTADAVLLGAVGGPQWDGVDALRRPEAGLLALRRELDLFANIRPVHAYPQLAAASPLRADLVAGADLVIYRELGGGLYYGRPRLTEPWPGPGGGDERAVDTMVYTTAEIERLVRLGFEAARRRRGLVTSVDKANVLECSRLWRRTVQQVARDYPDVQVEHAYVDSAAMELVARPRRFDVIVTENTFGDILSDLAACIGGSMGMLPSASLGTRGALYEPVHGSAPDIAGQDRANPLAAILSAAMMCELSLDWPAAARAIRTAVAAVLDAGYRTADIAGGRAGDACGTAEMGRRVRETLAKVWSVA